MNNQIFQKIPASQLFVSEPNPSWFGNPKNPQNDPNWTNQNWLKSRFHFSFAEYTNGPSQFGNLRVLNDDLVQPDRGFGTHPHSNMEICTYIIEGALTHQDSIGTKETLERGSIQFMTAGKGVQHSEHNLDKQKPLRFLQIWITPRSPGLPPNYGSFKAETDRKNRFAHLVSDVQSNKATPVKINQDTNIFVAEFDQEINYQFAEDRMAYFVCMEGRTFIYENTNENVLDRHDTGKIFGPTTLYFKPDKKAHIMILEMKKQ